MLLFETQEILLLIASTIVILMAVLSFEKDRARAALVLLFSGSMLLGFFMAGLDPFLNLWDEQYHALVAKNLSVNPFEPKLYTHPIFEYNFMDWAENHIWLHKQPLFLWQMAGSIALFGETEFAVRLPSVVLHGFASLLIYRIGRIALNRQVGFYGALFFTVAHYPLELIAGRYTTDHNDISFLFYTLASFWSWFEYQRSKKGYWLVLIGIFSGAAVLVKWLTGLLVYACWGFSILGEKSGWSEKFSSVLSLLKSAGIAFLVFLPWQIYIIHAFPVEAAQEYALNTAHFFQAVEGHGGDVWFHFHAIKKLYGSGDALPFILLVGLIVFMWKIPQRRFRIAIVSAIAITYVFFTLAATKMTSFTLIVSPFVFLGLGCLVDTLLAYIPGRKKQVSKVFRPLVLMIIAYFLLKPADIHKAHTMAVPNDNRNRVADLAQMQFIEAVEASVGKEGYVIFNADQRIEGQIAVMFYTDHIAYAEIPDPAMIKKAREEGYKIAIADDGRLPAFIYRDAEIVKIEVGRDSKKP